MVASAVSVVIAMCIGSVVVVIGVALLYLAVSGTGVDRNIVLWGGVL